MESSPNGGRGAGHRPGKPDRTVTRSFRVSESALDAIREEARRRNVTTNTLVNQLLTNYARVGRHWDKIHWMRRPIEWEKDLFDAIPDEKVAELGRLHGPRFKTFTIARWGEFSLPALLDDLRAIAEDGAFEYTEEVRDGRRTMQFIHMVGRKYSIYVMNALQAAFGALGVHPIISMTDNTIILELGPSSSSSSSSGNSPKYSY
jgi:hypothetical protein